METCEQEASYLFNVKVALANVIIKNKPPNTTAKEYTKILMKMLKDKDEQCENKIRDLTSELIHAKQDILKAQLESREHNTRSQNLLLVDDIENTLLTPPPSSDNEKTERHEINTLQRHAEFLRQILFFCQNKSTSSFAEDYISLVKETLDKIVQLLRKGETFLSLPDRILQSCINGIIDTLKSSSLSKHHSDIKGQVLSLVEHLVNEMICCKQTEYSHNIAKLLVPLGCCHVIRDGVLCCLMSCVVMFSTKLQDVIHGHVTLHSKVHEYENVYLVMWSIEQIFTNALHNVCPLEVKQQLKGLMEDSVVHISRSYPVFASAVWRLLALLEQ